MSPRPSDLDAALYEALADELAAARTLRRALHANPRVSGDEGLTTQLVIEALGTGIKAEPVAGSGALVRIGDVGPSVAVRAELDALPLAEATGVAWSSDNGAMHACGHDVHTAAAVALARAVSSLPRATPLVLILQPREEMAPSGALDVVSSGALERHDVRAVLAAHVQPLLARGMVASTPGAVNASADEFTVTMRGSGGHAAYPHLGPDPVPALAHFVVAVQQLVSRETDPMDSAVVSVGELQAGVSPNVRPEVATARGTIRAMNPKHRSTLITRLEAIASGVAGAAGCEVDVRIETGEPVLTNDDKLAEATAHALRQRGTDVTASLRSCGTDDFSYYSDRLPGLMLFVGTGQEAGRLHSAEFLPPDESVDDCAYAVACGYLAAAARIGAASSFAPNMP